MRATKAENKIGRCDTEWLSWGDGREWLQWGILMWSLRERWGWGHGGGRSSRDSQCIWELKGSDTGWGGSGKPSMASAHGPCRSSVQFSSVAQSCPTLCNPMNRGTPGLPVHHQLPEFTQTHVHWVCDAIQPSHPRVDLSEEFYFSFLFAAAARTDGRGARAGAGRPFGRLLC